MPSGSTRFSCTARVRSGARAALGRAELIAVRAVRRRPASTRRAPGPTGPCSIIVHGGRRGRRSTGAAGRARRPRPQAFLAGGIDPGQCRRRASGRRLSASTSARRSKCSPGIKDPAKVRALFDALRPTGARCSMRLDGRFGRFGGAYVPEILVPALEQLEAAFLDAQDDPASRPNSADLLATYAGRPTPLTRCRNLGGGAGAHLPEARGSAPRRRAQDQPGARPGAARQAHGQDAG